MRVVKEAAERRNEILDTAEKLFITKGYDKTSTNDILDRVGIARGTLYYHFKSKEEILNAMIERINGALITKAKTIASDTSIPVIDRSVMTIAALNVDTDIGHEIIDEVHKPQNTSSMALTGTCVISNEVPVNSGMDVMTSLGMKMASRMSTIPRPLVAIIICLDDILPAMNDEHRRPTSMRSQ